MPLKIILLGGFLSLTGMAIFVGLLRSLGKVLRGEIGRKKTFKVSFLLMGLLGFVFGLLAGLPILLPCFPFLFFDGPIICRLSASPEGNKRIALTFDDGPNEPYTSQILDILDAHKIPATFFLVGENIRRYPDVVARMIRGGYVIGNHTDDHRSVIFMNEKKIRDELEGWEEAIESLGVPIPVQESRRAVASRLFRAPHGWKTPSLYRVLQEKGYALIGWTVGVWDSDRPGEKVLLDRIFHRIKADNDGSILLLHDGEANHAGADRSQTVALLPDVIEHYQSLGFRFVSLENETKVTP